MENGFQKRNKKEQKEMAKLLAKAFHSHDNFVYFMENDAKRLQISTTLFQFMTKVINKFGYIYVVYEASKPVGYITFMDDQKYKMGLITTIRANAIWYAIKFWLLLSKEERAKYRTYMKTYNRLKHENPNHIHLYYTGVLPEFKGRGIMKESLNQALLHFKGLGFTGVTLETSDLSNVGLYKHLGYQVIDHKITKDGKQEIFLFQKKL